MLYILLFAVLFLISFLWAKYHDDFAEFAVFFSFLTGFILIVFLIGIPFCRAKDRAFLRSMKSVQQTIDTQRILGDPIERTAVVEQIIEYNQKLNELKWQRNNLWYNWFCDPSIEKAEPLK